MLDFLRHAMLFVLALAASTTSVTTTQHSSVFFAIYNLTDDTVMDRTDTALFRILYS